MSYLFTGCVTSQSQEPMSSSSLQQKNQKVFEEEDTLIMFALRTEELGDLKSSCEIFDTLY